MVFFDYKHIKIFVLKVLYTVYCPLSPGPTSTIPELTVTPPNVVEPAFTPLLTPEQVANSPSLHLCSLECYAAEYAPNLPYYSPDLPPPCTNTPATKMLPRYLQYQLNSKRPRKIVADHSHQFPSPAQEKLTSRQKVFDYEEWNAYTRCRKHHEFVGLLWFLQQLHWTKPLASTARSATVVCFYPAHPHHRPDQATCLGMRSHLLTPTWWLALEPCVSSWTGICKSYRQLPALERSGC